MTVHTQSTDLKVGADDLTALRIDLAAAFRWAARFDWNEAVANHFSAAVSADGRTFLLNPRWKHFSTVCASDLLLLDAEDESVMAGPGAPDPSAWCIHGAIHRQHPGARVVLHLHPPHATALSALNDPRILPIDQTTARFFNRMVIDLEFGGIADDAAEGNRIAATLGNRRILMMGNHGVSCIADSVAQAFDDLYHLERAARTMVLAYATGQPLNVMPDDLAEKTAAAWEDYSDAANAHFNHLKSVLDREEPNYRL